MERYQRIHDFTDNGISRFMHFLDTHLSPNFRGLEHAFESACLGTLEDRINEGKAITWEIAPACTRDKQTATFMPRSSDLIIESVESKRDFFTSRTPIEIKRSKLIIRRLRSGS